MKMGAQFSKRLLSVLLCLSMLLSVLLVPVSASGRKAEDSNATAEKTLESKETKSACTADGGEHSFDDSGVCTTCGLLALIIHMTDSYGDGWGGNAIGIYVDGELVETVTLDEGSEATWTGTYDEENRPELDSGRVSRRMCFYGHRG